VTTTPAAHLVKKATRTIPIVMVALGDPLDDISAAFAAASRARAQGALISEESMFIVHRARVTELAGGDGLHGRGS